jgi:ATP-binding cassette subfamily G (WHITE) protein 2
MLLAAACLLLLPSRCRAAGGTCPVTSGQQTIDRLDLDQLNIGANAAALLGYILLCRLVAFLGMRFLKW